MPDVEDLKPLVGIQDDDDYYAPQIDEEEADVGLSIEYLRNI